jgi:hypothetical protein
MTDLRRHTVMKWNRTRRCSRALGVIALVAGLLAACNQPFDPRAPLDQQMVVYTVLSTDRTVQYVRVNSNYMPSGYDATAYTTDTRLAANVRLIGDNTYLYFRDTAIARPDTSRYKFPLRLYTANPFVPGRGKSYNLIVESPTLGVTQASVTVPAKPIIGLSSISTPMLAQPLSADKDSRIEYTVDLAGTAGGYTSHLYIYYDVLKGNKWVEERFEVPLEPQTLDTTYSLERPTYDQLNPTSLSKRVTVRFRAGYLQKIIKKLTLVQYADTHLIFKWIVLTVLQTDRNLFAYYKSVRGYQDPLSIRLDQPLYSKIDGGVGLVGAYALDSLTFVLPEVFGGNR